MCIFRMIKKVPAIMGDKVNNRTPIWSIISEKILRITVRHFQKYLGIKKHPQKTKNNCHIIS